MRINFLVNEVFNGWEPTDTRLGGTEESVERWATELIKRGHSAHVYRNGRGTPLPKLWFNYHERVQYEGGGDICINIKSSDIPPKEPTLYLTNETNANTLDLSKYLGVIWPSQWAVDNIPVNNKTFILPHGYDPEKIYPGKKVPKQCFYASSPDRGLETLLEAWPKVHEAHPDATLILTYGGFSDLPGVINLGECDEDTMNEIYRTSEYWLHPCSGGELFCITGKKAQAAGCWPVYFPVMALAETVAFGKKSTPETFAEDVIAELSKDPPVLEAMMSNSNTYLPTWSDTTDKLLEIISSVL